MSPARPQATSSHTTPPETSPPAAQPHYADVTEQEALVALVDAQHLVTTLGELQPRNTELGLRLQRARDRAQTRAREPSVASRTPLPQPILPMPEPASPLTPVVPVRPVARTFDVFCLLCAREVGRGGVRLFPHRLPCRRRCIWCGGVLLAEDLTRGTSLREERTTAGRKLLDDAALERAAR